MKNHLENIQQAALLLHSLVQQFRPSSLKYLSEEEDSGRISPLRSLRFFKAKRL
jgi:hypothetical protein